MLSLVKTLWIDRKRSKSRWGPCWEKQGTYCSVSLSEVARVRKGQNKTKIHALQGSEKKWLLMSENIQIGH